MAMQLDGSNVATAPTFSPAAADSLNESISDPILWHPSYLVHNPEVEHQRTQRPLSNFPPPNSERLSTSLYLNSRASESIIMGSPPSYGHQSEIHLPAAMNSVLSLPPAYVERREVSTSASSAAAPHSTIGHEAGFIAAPLPALVQHSDLKERSIIFCIHSFASSSTSLPILVEGQELKGSLTLPTMRDIRKISISFRGLLLHKQNPYNIRLEDTRSSEPEIPIVDHERVLYTDDLDELCPNYLPFSMDLPNLHNDSEQPGSASLPASFRGSVFSVTYDIHVTIKRGSFKPRIEFNRPCWFLPFPIPPNPVPRMLQAYSNRSTMPSLYAENSGWYECPAAETYGSCRSGTARICSKLVYSRMTHIPLRLTITSHNPDVIQLLSAPGVPRLCLIQQEQRNLKSEIISTRRSKTCGRKVARSASTWLAPNSQAISGGVTFSAEIALDSSLAPSLSFGKFALKYYVVLFPWSCPGLVLARPEDVALIQQEVEIIATPLRPQIPSYAPPEAKSHPVSISD
ncbi:hypothetical protein SISSUDRAFT_93202 [Sistotremastrum suecicum HHB10207 ss-3]|uniref:Arrestin-like N-terminal domain-containing protein n=1 Tax=Sistotremastrum suecicum HHB10207 ss-3 TaxID=1314776 RepID=A0A166B9K6_9AGAM|nr:hypothetical protein SISSUDRAFT_93202 [Sistotremastrum suecicum HHB10207 ss-3]